jgi:glycerophosphoryl diester phosphodiesterase
MKPRELFCFGHRGACGHEPENTLRSVRRALELGADGVEVDVHWADGQLVVIHDDTLDRTTNGHGRVADKSFSHLRSLNAGLAERIPTLAEVFETVRRRAVINIELKGPGTAAPVVALMAEFVNHRGWRPDDFLVSSFDHAQIRAVSQLNPQILTGVLIAKVPPHLEKLLEQLHPWSLHVSKRCVSEKLVLAAHARGLRIFVYTVNEPAEIARMKALAVDGVFSDFPERITA